MMVHEFGLFNMYSTFFLFIALTKLKVVDYRVTEPQGSEEGHYYKPEKMKTRGNATKSEKNNFG